MPALGTNGQMSTSIFEPVVVVINVAHVALGPWSSPSVPSWLALAVTGQLSRSPQTPSEYVESWLCESSGQQVCPLTDRRLVCH